MSFHFIGKINGAVPVKLKVTLGSGEPEHTGPPPLIVAVGNGFTTTLTVPPRAVAHTTIRSGQCCYPISTS